MNNLLIPAAFALCMAALPATVPQATATSLQIQNKTRAGQSETLTVRFADSATTAADIDISRRFATHLFGCPVWNGPRHFRVSPGKAETETINITKCMDPEMFSARYYLTGTRAFVRISCSFDLDECDVSTSAFPVRVKGQLINASGDFSPSGGSFDIHFTPVPDASPPAVAHTHQA